ncbi:MAG TPA: hypothetical protein VF540_13470 [Segetibacter sp.]|jgi:hypothetical protein
MVELDENWRVVLLFPDEFNDFIAEIYYQDVFLCMISQESGYDQLDIEIASKPNGEDWNFKLSDFEKAVERAKQRLWDLRKTE